MEKVKKIKLEKQMKSMNQEKIFKSGDRNLSKRKLLMRYQEEINLVQATSTVVKKVDRDVTSKRMHKSTSIWMLSAFYLTQ